jgi:hypothetical protein
MDTLEKLCRGSFTDDPTIISQKFSQGFYRMLVEKNCTEHPIETKDLVVQNDRPKWGGDVSVEKFEKKLTKNEIDIEFLNQLLKPDCEFVLDDDELFFGEDQVPGTAQ